MGKSLPEALMAATITTTRWSVRVTEATDQALRTFLAQNRPQKGEMSHFIEEAVQDRLAALTLQQVRSRNRAVPQDKIIADIDEAVKATRAHRS
jgi:hypothetical protein